jgi:predicted acyltransferase (DUF342 family)
MFKKNLKVLGFIPILSILLLLGLYTPAKAAEFKTENYTLQQSEVVEDNVYVIGDTVEVAGVIDGDLFAISDITTVSGTITGDLYVSSSSVNLSGNVYGSTFLVGESVDVSGSVARNVFLMSMFSDISGSVGKDAAIFSVNSSVSGKVTEDLRIFANQSHISGVVNGEALIRANSSTVDKELIKGDIYENVGADKDIKSGEKYFKNIFQSINVLSILIGFIAMYIVGVVLIYLAPIKTLEIEKKVVSSTQEFLFSFLTGLIIFIVLPLPLILLSITIIGLPLAILIIGFLIFTTLFGTIWVESAIGYKILSTTDRKDPQRLLSLLIGRGLTTVVSFIPIVRGLYRFVLGLTATGAIVRMKYDVYKNRGKQKKSKK